MAWFTTFSVLNVFRLRDVFLLDRRRRLRRFVRRRDAHGVRRRRRSRPPRGALRHRGGGSRRFLGAGFTVVSGSATILT
jgi:hypothetical protein